MFSRPKILFLVSLLFCSTIEFNPYLPFEFLIFYHTVENIELKQIVNLLSGYPDPNTSRISYG